VGKELAHRVKIITYESLLAGRERPGEQGGVYIFTNLGRVSTMDPKARSAIYGLHDRLVTSHGADRVLNDPARSLRRYDLLRRLHERGINSFNAHRAGDATARIRLPAFIRHELQSIFQPPAMARDPEQYAALLRGIKWLRGSLDEFIAVEFCDTADAGGLCRKYGAFVVGDRIVPRHIYYSRNWHIRSDDLSSLTMIEEELQFLNDNPHADALLQCARLAGISYGRFDYGLLDGRPQIWEVNTNPGVVIPPKNELPERKAVHLTFVRMFSDAMTALDGETPLRR
jgi:hypothetical protein